MRTTVDIPDNLLEQALQASNAKTKTMAIVMGLQELINRHKLDQLRALQGRVNLTTDVRVARRR